MDPRAEIAQAILAKAGPYYGRRPFALHKAALYIAANRLRVGVRDVGAIPSTEALNGADAPALVVILSSAKGHDFVARALEAVEVMKLAGTAMVGAAEVDPRFAAEIRQLVARPDSSAAGGYRIATVNAVIGFAGVGVFGALIRQFAGHEPRKAPLIVVPANLLADDRQTDLVAYIEDERHWLMADDG